MDATLAGLPRSTELYEAALEGLVRVNEWLYRRHPSWPAVVDPRAHVRYQREAGEVWRHVGDVLASGWGDCEDLAAAMVAWLRVRRGERGARVMVKRTGPRMSHAVVRRASGRIEDPSRALGMGRRTVNVAAQVSAVAPMRRDALPVAQPAAPTSQQSQYYDGSDDGVIDVPYESAEQAEDYEGSGDWESLGADPSESVDITWTVQREGNGWRGTLRVPLNAGRMLLVSRVDGKKDGAAKKAVGAASRVLDNPAVSALIPPQARFALNLARSETARNMAKSILKLF